MDPKVLSALEASVQPVSLADELPPFRGLLYGSYGMGKTTLAVRIAQVLGGRTALVTTDSAWTVIYKESPEVLATIDRIPYQGFSHVTALAQAHDEGIEPYNGYNNLIWDTVSTGNDQTLRNLVDQKQFGEKHQLDPMVEGWPHYRIAARLLRDAIVVLNKSKLNIIYIGHVREPSENDKAKMKLAIRANMPQACYDVIAQEVNLVGWLHKEKRGTTHRIQTEGTIAVEAKSQIPTIPQSTLDADEIPALIAKWRNQQ